MEQVKKQEKNKTQSEEKVNKNRIKNWQILELVDKDLKT